VFGLDDLVDDRSGVAVDGVERFCFFGVFELHFNGFLFGLDDYFLNRPDALAAVLLERFALLLGLAEVAHLRFLHIGEIGQILHDDVVGELADALLVVDLVHRVVLGGLLRDDDPQLSVGVVLLLVENEDVLGLVWGVGVSGGSMVGLVVED
jgi:hypothetical protein